jgi:hypothetical protein
LIILILSLCLLFMAQTMMTSKLFSTAGPLNDFS